MLGGGGEVDAGRDLVGGVREKMRVAVFGDLGDSDAGVRGVFEKSY